MKYIDLHVHSTASDGTLTPSEVVDHAIEVGLSAFALTDHDTLRGVAEAKERAAWHKAQGHPVEVYPGVEISAAYKNRDIHILGLLVDETNEILDRALTSFLENRNRRNDKMLEKFAEHGIELTMQDLTEDAPGSVITRAHFARALMKKRIVTSVQEAFEKYVGDDGPCYVAREYMPPEQAISIIKKAGGVPVLAHPLLYKLPHDELYSLVERLKNAGLKGIEVYYSNNRGQDEVNVKALANHFGLIATGGSDFHGAAKPAIELGSGKGNLKIPYSVLENVIAAK
ncbi:MAG: PHP domain-containing protein [Lachnospiraceae bacterium]|nr:PHP domain-containing protein [Lachnospiraceae bacterium]